MIHPKALGKMAQSTCHIARASHSEVIASLILPNIGNIHLCWVHMLGSTSNGHANAVVMEGEGFLQTCSLCTHSSLTSMDGVEITVLQAWNGRNIWIQKDTSMEICAELIPQLKRHSSHKQ